ncbi:MAG: hypothetical protein WCF81_03875 [Roseiarcus sp.]
MREAAQRKAEDGVIGSATKLIRAGPTMQRAPIVITVSRAFTIWS